jgi:phosphate transport system substrate-binding protein
VRRFIAAPWRKVRKRKMKNSITNGMSALLGAAAILCLTSCAPSDAEAPGTGTSAGTAVAAGTAATGGAIKVDPRIPSYRKVSGVYGNLSSVGSDTMNNLMALWGEKFRRYYPSVKIQVEGKGSSTAPPALIEGAAQLGPMSRPMKSSEVEKFEDHYGFPPTQIKTSLDALAVYLNKDNPVDAMTLTQVDAIFSKHTKCGNGEQITRWGQLDLQGSWANKPISLYGRNSASGTYGYFKKHALCKGDYKDTVKEQPGSASVVQGITEDLYGIGYSGIGYKTSGVKAIALAKDANTPMAEPSMDNVSSGKYPLARHLYLYAAKDPSKPLSPLVREFLLLVLSKEGQEIVIKDGYLPLPYETVQEMRAALTK